MEQREYLLKWKDNVYVAFIWIEQSIKCIDFSLWCGPCKSAVPFCAQRRKTQGVTG
jgi:thiol-disulfide isomerase/thioredoxin